MSTDETTIAHLFAADAPDQAPAQAMPAHSDQQPLPPDVDYGFNPQPQPAPAAPQPEPQREEPRQVPLAELIETRRRAQAAEQERQEMRQQNQQLMEALSRLTRPQQPAPQPIDPVADPEGAYQTLEQRMQSALLNQQLNFSEMRARDKHGNDLVDEALAAAQRAGYAQSFINRADAYGEMLNWYQGQKLQQEIGADPVAYRARIAAEVKAELLAQFRGGPSTPPNLPPSLSTATKANSAPEVVTDSRDFFNSMMSTRRT